MISHSDCRLGVRVAFRHCDEDRSYGVPAVELGTVDMIAQLSLDAGSARPVRVRWASGESTWPRLAEIELATDELEDEYGRACP